MIRRVLWTDVGIPVILFALVVASALSVVVVRQLNRVEFYQVQRLQVERDDLTIEWQQWMAERSTWRLEHNIESDARQKLSMKPPIGEDIKTIVRNQGGS